LSKNEREIKAVKEAAEFISPDCKLDDALVTFGMQLDALEAIDSPKSIGVWMNESADAKKPKTKEDFKQKAIAFLKKFGENILKNTCAWWTDNKDKVADSSKLIAAITPIIAAAIPLPWGAIAGIVAIIAVILFKAGMDTVCPTGTAKASLPWM
jgi:hypothetical protein